MISAHADEPPGYGVAVLDKALDVLECMIDGQPWSIARLSTATTLNRASIYRLMATLERRAYVTRRGERQGYLAGPALLSLCRLLLSNTALTRVARPILMRLHQELGETVNLAVLDRDQIRYLDIVQSDHGLRMTAQVGALGPLHCTSVGKAILAQLDSAQARELLPRQPWRKLTPKTSDSVGDLLEDLEATRSRGFAIDDEETEIGARCVGVAILDEAGRPIAGLSVSGPAWRMPPEKFARIGRTLLAAAREVAEKAGYAEPATTGPLEAPR